MEYAQQLMEKLIPTLYVRQLKEDLNFAEHARQLAER
jgi:hypothetical protein